MALTLRLEDQEIQQLERIKQQLGVSTATAAIKHMIFSYEQTQRRLDDLHHVYQQQAEETTLLKARITSYFQTRANIEEMLNINSTVRGNL